MEVLTKNMLNIFGKQGEKWLADLPEIITILAETWDLNRIHPVDNMTYNYVAKVTSKSNKPLVLKISCDEKIIKPERKALQFFHGEGSIELFDYNEKYHALLLQQAIPGASLKSLYPTQVELVMEKYVAIMQMLHQNKVANNSSFPHIREWLEAIDHCDSKHIPKELLEEAQELKDKLLSSLKNEILLHGDLHHDNILQNGHQWLAIDPKGIIGEPEFEIASFDFIDKKELFFHRDIKALFEERVKLIAKISNLNLNRIKEWVFVRLILSAAWSIADNDDPAWVIELARKIRNEK